ncbi:MAG TPA: alanine racemase [Tepidisphaeraceae bacterium]
MDVRQSHGEPRMLISREALIHNLRLIRGQLNPKTKICAMVKADAYGHGADIVIDTLCNFVFEDLPSPLIDMLGVGCLDEAAAITETILPILIFRPVENIYMGRQREALENAIRLGWILTLNTAAAADDVARIAMSLGRRAAIHVMLDTGMTRDGCSIDQLPQLLSRIESHSSLRLLSIGTHFASSEIANDNFLAEQFDHFCTATDGLATNRQSKLLRHVANSGGIFFAPSTHLDMVRPGISLYGIDPTCKPQLNRPLRPVAKWTAPIVSILEAKKGSTIGYGQTWTAPHDTRIGLIPIGYADGYLRAWSNRATMLVNGIPAPVVGRVSMDLTTIDLHDIPSAKIGDEITVMDDDPLSAASAYALANLADTIPYEVLTRIGSRIRRVAVEPVEDPSPISISLKIKPGLGTRINPQKI